MQTHSEKDKTTEVNSTIRQVEKWAELTATNLTREVAEGPGGSSCSVFKTSTEALTPLQCLSQALAGCQELWKV